MESAVTKDRRRQVGTGVEFTGLRRHFAPPVFIPVVQATSSNLAEYHGGGELAEPRYSGVQPGAIVFGGVAQPIEIAVTRAFDWAALSRGSLDTGWVALGEVPISTTAVDEIDDDDLFQTLIPRLAELSACASEESIKISDASRRDLQRFIGTHPGLRPPSLFLLDNGNFRAVWRNARGEQLALQFLGHEAIQYVIFVASEDMPGGFARHWGGDGFGGIERWMKTPGVRGLMAR